MGYRAFREETSLDEAREATEYTFEALDAYPVKEVASLARPLGALLEAVAAIEGAQRAARRATIRANARVRTADGMLDDTVGEFAKDVLGTVRQDRAHSLYLALFPTAPSAIEQMTLAPELDEVERFIAVLEGKETPADLRKKWLTVWKHLTTTGQAALAERKAAATATADASAQAVRWVERADRARRSLDGALTTFAAEHGLDRDFNDRFFPVVTNAGRKKAPPAGSGNGGAAGAPGAASSGG